MVVRYPETGEEGLAMAIRLAHHKGVDNKPFCLVLGGLDWLDCIGSNFLHVRRPVVVLLRLLGGQDLSSRLPFCRQIEARHPTQPAALPATGTWERGQAVSSPISPQGAKMTCSPAHATNSQATTGV